MKRKILITDDDAAIQTMLKRSLARHGFDVICAYHGLEAIQLAQKENPDLILMDLNMPGLKGEDVLQELRAQFKTRMTPVIFLTGMNSKEDVIHGLSLGADDYLCKPFDVEELVARIDSSLRRCLVNLDANPLTRLPGNHAINKEIVRRLDLKKPFSVLYGDLNEFKAYNDHYGFLSGNTVIEKTGQIFEQMAGEKATLVGHLGGDDFIIVTDRTDVEVLCKNILRTFDEQLQSFYTPEDFEAGSVLVKDRNGSPRSTPLISLAIGVVNIDRPEEWTLAAIAATGAEVKTKAKMMGKSAIAFENGLVRHGG